MRALSVLLSVTTPERETYGSSIDHALLAAPEMQEKAEMPPAAWGQAGREAAAPLPGTASASVPSPQPESISISPSWCLTVTRPKPGLAPTALDLGGLQWAAPILPCPHTFPCPLRSRLGQCRPWAWKPMGRNPSEGLCCVTHALNTPSLLLKNSAPDNPHPHQSRGRERGSSTRRQLAWK